MSDWQVADIPSMSQRTWHYDKGRLCIDSVSRCGNCYSGIVTSEYTAAFDGTDRMELRYADGHGPRYSGWYKRVPISDTLRASMERQEQSGSDIERSQARMVLFAMDEFVRKSNR